MSKKKRKKPKGCGFLICCSGTDNEDVQNFDDFEDHTLVRGRILLQQYEESRRSGHPTSSELASATESRVLDGRTSLVSEDTPTHDTAHTPEADTLGKPSNTFQNVFVRKPLQENKVVIETTELNTDTKSESQIRVQIKEESSSNEAEEEGGNDEHKDAEQTKGEKEQHSEKERVHGLASCTPGSKRTVSDERYTSLSHSPLKNRDLSKDDASISIKGRRADPKVKQNDNKPSTSKQPAPPSTPNMNSSISRASKPSLPEDHPTFMSKNDVLDCLKDQVSDDMIIPVKRRGTTSTDLIGAFIAGSDSSVEAIYSGSSTDSELYKLIDFNNLRDSSDEQPANFDCNRDTVLENQKKNTKVRYFSPADVSGPKERESSFMKMSSIPDTKLPHPLGASPVVLGPIIASKRTPEQTQKTKDSMTHLKSETSSPSKAKLSVARRLDFNQHQDINPANGSLRCLEKPSQTKALRKIPSELKCLDSSNESINQKGGTQLLKPHGTILAKTSHVSSVHIKSSRMEFPVPSTSRECGNFQPRRTSNKMLPTVDSSVSSFERYKRTGTEHLLKPHVSSWKKHSVDSMPGHQSPASSKPALPPVTPTRDRVELKPWREKKQSSITMDSLDPTENNLDEPIMPQPVRKHLNDLALFSTKSSTSSSSATATAASEHHNMNSRNEHHSGRPAGTTTSQLPAPLSPPDLLAPSLFRRRIGQDLPPVQGSRPPPRQLPQIRSVQAPTSRAGQTSTHRTKDSDRLTKRVRTKPFK